MTPFKIFFESDSGKKPLDVGDRYRPWKSESERILTVRPGDFVTVDADGFATCYDDRPLTISGKATFGGKFFREVIHLKHGVPHNLKGPSNVSFALSPDGTSWTIYDSEDMYHINGIAYEPEEWKKIVDSVSEENFDDIQTLGDLF